MLNLRSRLLVDKLTGKEINQLLWKSKVHYRVHKSLSLDPILSQTNLVCKFTPYLRSVSIICFYLRLDIQSDIVLQLSD
jgi:hypothetical protein